MPTLLWFRRDLRVHDLPALLDAAEPDGEVLACYVLDPRLEASSGARRLQYLYDALRELRDALDGRLMVTRGRPEKRIPLLAKAIDATSVHVSADYSPFGRRRDDAVRDALGDVPLEESGSAYLVSPGRVVKGNGEPYKVFTPYFDAWRRHGWRAPAKSGPKTARWIDPADVTGGVEIPDTGVELELPAGRAGRDPSVEEVRRRRPRRLRRRPQPARPPRHQPDVGAPEVRHHPPAHDGRRPRQGQGRAGLPAGAGIPRLLRRSAQRVAGQRLVELEQVLRLDGGRRGRRGARRRSRRGRRAGPASRSSTPVCASWPRPAGCTTGCG